MPISHRQSHIDRIKQIESIIEDDNYIVQLERYPLLREEDINKVNKAFNKLFTPLFKGHRQFMQDKILPSAGIPYISNYVNDLLKEVNETVIGFVV